MEIAFYVIWPIIFIAGIFLELHTASQLGTASVVASVAALITHAFTKGNPVWIEMIVFIGTWVVTWVVLFIFFKEYTKKLRDTKDSFYGYIGNTYTVTKSNDGKAFGYVKIDDVEYKTSSEEKLHEGDVVKVNKIKGHVLFVSKLKGEK